MSQDIKRFHLLLPSRHGNLLAVKTENGLALPSVAVPPDADILDARLICRAVRDQLGAEVTLLHSMHCYRRPDAPMCACTLELQSADWHPVAPHRWIAARNLAGPSAFPEFECAVAAAWFRERETGEALLPWWRPEWAAKALSWAVKSAADAGYYSTAPPEQLKSWYLSSLWRLPTRNSNLYFKAVPPYSNLEVALAAAWTADRTEGAQQVVAIESERSWLLTADMKGISLEQNRNVEFWGAALEDLARFQVQTACHVDGYLAAGCDDLRMGRLTIRAAQLFGAAGALVEGLPAKHIVFDDAVLEKLLPGLDARCRVADTFGIPATLVHGDFHGMNVVREGGRTVFFDWSDASICHPFFDVMELLSSDDWLPPTLDSHDILRDSYLAQWREFGTVDRMRELYDLLRPLWLLAGALAHERMLTGMETVIPLALRNEHTCAHWATQQQQYALAVRLRDLIDALT